MLLYNRICILMTTRANTQQQIKNVKFQYDIASHYITQAYICTCLNEKALSLGYAVLTVKDPDHAFCMCDRIIK